MKHNISIVLADDHPLLMKGLQEYLTEKCYNVVACAKDGIEAASMIERLNPDIAILDIDMPRKTGLEVSKMGYENGWHTKFILLSYLKEPEFIVQAKSVNIRGYIIKDDAMSELDRCIQCVYRGETYFSSKIREQNTFEASTKLDLLKSLTPSELKILKLIAQHMSSKEIGEFLHISQRTVEKHRSHIMSKLQLSGQGNGLRVWVVENKNLFQ